MGAQADPKQTTEKYGLEAGLWQIFTSKDPVTGKTKGDQAKDLLKKYGSAYLITSISFAIVSFAACYALVYAGLALPSAASWALLLGGSLSFTSNHACKSCMVTKCRHFKTHFVSRGGHGRPAGQDRHYRERNQ